MYEIPNSEDFASKFCTTELHREENDLELSVEYLALTNCEIIAELKEILIAIQSYRKRSNFVKTAGTTIGVSGAIALCAAPLTAGLSTTLGIGGIIATGTSAVTAIGSNIAYKRKSRHFAENIERLHNKQQLAAQELTLKLNIINSVVEEIVIKSDVDEQTALKTTIYHINRKTIRLVIDGCDFVLKDTVIGRKLSQHMNRLKELAITAVINRSFAAKGLHPQEVVHELSSTMFNAALRIGHSATKEFNEFQVLVKTAGQSLKGTTGRTVLHGFGAAIGVIFSVIDVALLIRDWTNPDPLIHTITSTIKDLENDIGKCADILNVLRYSDTEVEQPGTSTDVYNNNSCSQIQTSNGNNSIPEPEQCEIDI